MKSFLGVLMLVAGSALATSAATHDSEGMPIVYLRGSFGNWGVDKAYRFTRDGNHYSLEIGAGNEIGQAEFKIADEEWSGFDFGGQSKDINVNESMELSLARAGSNLHTNGLYDCKISFDYTGDSEKLNVKFEFRGQSQSSPWSGTLPVMFINVYIDESHSRLNNEVIDMNLSHKDYFTYAEYWIDLNDCDWMAEEGANSVGSEEEPLPLQIKARGNWTRIGFAKKPFKIKLDKKQNLLGLTPEKSKHYALLAHADDNKGFLRNFTGFNLGERIGLPWTPAMQPVELVVNGDYRGLYFLTESVRVGDGRIVIEELDDNVNDPELVSGGYVVELDNYDEDNQIRMEELSFVHGHNRDMLRITWDTPEIYSDLQRRFITDQFTAINKAIGSNNNEIWAYLDLDDAARYYLVQEIISHVEAFHGSTYLYRDRGEGQKWHFSPLWDLGNAFNGNTNSYFFDCDPYGNTWIPSLMENSSFKNKVKETWLWFMQKKYPGIEEDMAAFAAHVQAAARADKKRWSGQPHPNGGMGVADNSDINGKLKEVKDHLEAKVKWLKGRFGDYTSGTYDEPFRDETPASLLPDYAQAGIPEISDMDIDASTEFYNLQGIRILRPQEGQVYIVRKGSRSFKIIYKN